MKTAFRALYAAALAVGVAGLAAATDGFRVVTSDSAHRLAVARVRPRSPDFSLTDADGAAFSLSDYRARIVLVEFVYTSCPVICGALGNGFGELQKLVVRDPATDRISLLSISFDVAHDRAADLKSYGGRFAAASPLWRIALPPAGELTPLLDSFGVVVIPDGRGRFIHNAAISVVDKDRRLVRVLDPTEPRLLLAQVSETVAR
jgi:protein SCO1/2